MKHAMMDLADELYLCMTPQAIKRFEERGIDPYEVAMDNATLMMRQKGTI